ncbi:MAG: hydroxyacid dehydrogenase, partial [Nocardioidaceae bacterium]
MTKPVVLIAEQLSPATVEALGPDFEIKQCNGADRTELLSAIADVDAILVRSATKVDAEALAAAHQLKVIARAGVGLDNVDVKQATLSGVMVVNAPTSNIVSAAELAVGLLLDAARHIGPANASLKAGEWKRSQFSGTELYEKTVGIVGLGKIGVLVAQRLSAFGMKVIAHDPYVQAGRAAQLGVRLVPLDELLAEADFVSVHLPKTPETIGLIGAEQLAKCKPSAIVVNAARGGIIDEHALHVAVKEGQIAGAGLDVFASEPCTDS